MEEFILGIDDAGRGPVIGPMILAGCLVTKHGEAKLRKIGVKDSKQLTQKKREILAEEIKKIAETFEVVLATAEEIDNSLNSGTKLNELEAIKISKIINKINNGSSKIKIIIDCPSVSIDKWRDFLKTQIQDLKNLEIICEHKADQNHPTVSAASILAKSTRENEMDKLKKDYGIEIGSGYTSDPSTIKFIEKYAIKHSDKGIFRKSWITWQNASKKIQQRTLI